ncbi:MAG: hypothetical protein IKQ15_03110 [Kiritimatiellae bacterium]|nr:hypothetical protein [Kiritimatiellia bacterium]
MIMRFFGLLAILFVGFFLPADLALACPNLALHVSHKDGTPVLAINGCEHDRQYVEKVLKNRLDADPTRRLSVMLAPEITVEEASNVLLFVHRMGFKNIEIYGYSRVEDGTGGTVLKIILEPARLLDWQEEGLVDNDPDQQCRTPGQTP